MDACEKTIPTARKRPKPRRRKRLRKHRFEIATDSEPEDHELIAIPSQRSPSRHVYAVSDHFSTDRQGKCYFPEACANEDRLQGVDDTVEFLEEEAELTCTAHAALDTESINADLNAFERDSFQFIDEPDSDQSDGEGLSRTEDEILPRTGKEELNEREDATNRTILDSWQKMLAVLAVTGTNRLSRDQFEFFRNTVNWVLETFAAEEKRLPSYSTLQRRIVPFLRKNCFASSETFSLPLDIQKAEARKRCSSEATAELAPAQVVLPSEWARRDVSFKPTWELLKHDCSKETSRFGNDTCFRTIAESPLVSRRELILEKPNSSLFNGRVPLGSSNTFFSPNLPVHIIMESSPAAAAFDMPYCWSYKTFADTLKFWEERGSSRVIMRARLRETKLMTTIDELLQGNITGCVNDQDSVQKGNYPTSRPGDLCTTLDVSTSMEFTCFLIHRFGGGFRSGYQMELLWVCNDLQHRHSGGKNTETRGVRKHSQIVLGITQPNDNASQSTRIVTSSSSHFQNQNITGTRGPSDSQEIPGTGYSHVHECQRSIGSLQDGRRYFVYRILLYSDGFSQHRQKNGSAGGIYLMPLNLLPNNRTSRKAVRLISVTPPEFGTREVLRLIAENLKRASTEGTEVKDGDGNPIFVFTQLVAYVGDYLEVAHISDKMGHMARAPCHLCSSRSQNTDPMASSYRHTTEINSLDSSSFRSGARSYALRNWDLEDGKKNDLFNFLGINPSNSLKFTQSPLFLLHDVMRKVQTGGKVPLATCGHAVLNASFDPYRSVLVAPDHLLSGNAINLLTTVFVLFNKERRIDDVELRICDALKVNGLLTQEKIFDIKNKAMFSTSLSGTFCTLLMAQAVFSDVGSYLVDTADKMKYGEMEPLMKCIELLRMFTELVSITYWYPKVLVDGPMAVEFFNREKGSRMHLEQMERAMQFVQKCDELCRMSPVAMKHLDKPNLHRVIELYAHSVPSMGHANQFAELVFEFAHQPLKRGVERSNGIEPHIQAVFHALADEWQDRLAAMVQYYSNGRQKCAFEIHVDSSWRRLLGCGSDGNMTKYEILDASDSKHGNGLLIEPVLSK